MKKRIISALIVIVLLSSLTTLTLAEEGVKYETKHNYALNPDMEEGHVTLSSPEIFDVNMHYTVAAEGKGIVVMQENDGVIGERKRTIKDVAVINNTLGKIVDVAVAGNLVAAVVSANSVYKLRFYRLDNLKETAEAELLSGGEFEISQVKDIEFEMSGTKGYIYLRTSVGDIHKLKVEFCGELNENVIEIEERYSYFLRASDPVNTAGKVNGITQMTPFKDELYLLVENENYEYEDDRGQTVHGEKNNIYRYNADGATTGERFAAMEYYLKKTVVNENGTAEEREHNVGAYLIKSFAVDNKFVYIGTESKIYLFLKDIGGEPYEYIDYLAVFPNIDKTQLTGSGIPPGVNENDPDISGIRALKVTQSAQGYRLCFADKAYNRIINSAVYEIDPDYLPQEPPPEEGGILPIPEKYRLYYRFYYGSKGTESDRLSSPQDVAYNSDGSEVYIADRDNHRIVRYDLTREITGVKVRKRHVYVQSDDFPVSSPRLITVDGDTLYVADNGGIAQLAVLTDENQPMAYEKRLNTDGLLAGEKAVEMRIRENILFVLTDKNNLYHYVDYRFKRIASFDYSAKTFEFSVDKSKLYVRGEKEEKILMNGEANRKLRFIYCYDTQTVLSSAAPTGVNGKEIESLRLDITSLEKPGDIVIDYKGNIIVADNFLRNSFSQATLRKYTRIENGYAQQSTAFVAIEHPFDTIAAVAFDKYNGDIVVIDSAKHLATRLSGKEIGMVGEYSVSSNPTEYDILRAGYADSDIIMQASPDNFETVTKLSAGQIVLALTEHEYNGDKYHFIRTADKKFGYVALGALNLLDASTETDMRGTAEPLHVNSGAAVFRYPFSGSAKVDTIPFGREIAIINNVASKDGKHVWESGSVKWYYVSYLTDTGKEAYGYVRKSDLSPKAPAQSNVTNKKLVVSPQKIGDTVVFYNLPDTASGIINSNVTAGTKVYIAQDEFDEDSEFTRVMLDGKTGYILTKHLKEGGLSNIELAFAIIVPLTAAAIALTVIIVVRNRRRGANR